MEQVKPITPEEVVDSKANVIPNAILVATNLLIAENWNGDNSIFKLKTLKEKIQEVDPELTISNVRWLDIEPIYRKAGWVVEYHSPAMDETYDAYFNFSRKG